MPHFDQLMDMAFLGDTVRAYAVAAATFMGLVLALRLLKRLILGRLRVWAEKTHADFDDFLVRCIGQVGTPTFAAVSLYFSTLSLSMPERARSLIRTLLVLVLTIRAVLMAQEVIRYAIRKAYQKRYPGDVSAGAVVKNLTVVAQWALWGVGAVFILDNLGVNISALMAGLGIGGVAVAMASQAVLGDLFSALSIFVDKPFEVGDFIVVDDCMGTVEHTGLKTTRVRSLSGEQLVFSNSSLTSSRIRNFKRMELRRAVVRFGVAYETSIEKLRDIPLWVRGILQRVDGVKLDRIHFFRFGDSSIDFELVYFVLSADYNVHMDRQQEILLALKETLEKQGVEFAYPTRTIYWKTPQNAVKG